jgi:polyhydroxyalkanoate synthesis regulator protein
MANAFGPGAFGPGALGAMSDQVRRNTEMFEQAMRMFLPFGAGRTEAQPRPPEGPPASEPTGDIDALRRQLDDMQKRLDKLSTKE